MMPIIIACVAGIALFVFLMKKPNLTRTIRNHRLDSPIVTPREIPDAVRKLERSGHNGSFVVFIFVPPGSTTADAVNLQYSKEGDVVGLDWVLLGPRNVADREKISEFAGGFGYRFTEQEGNNVRYLRVTGAGIADLGVKMIQNFYKLPSDVTLDLVVEGFEWPPKTETHE